MAELDNPVGSIIDNLFSTKRSSSTDYILKLSEFREASGMTPMERMSFLVKHTDPFGILRRGTEFKRTKATSSALSGGGSSVDKLKSFDAFTDTAARIGSFLSGGRFDVAPGGISTQPKTDLQKRLHAAFGRLSQVEGLELVEKGKEIYIGSAQLGFVPLPVQGPKGSLEESIVQIGSKRRGAYQAMLLGTAVSEKSYGEIYYNKFLQTVEGLKSKKKVTDISNLKSPLVVFDIETTGTKIKEAGNKFGKLSTGADQEIIQFAAVRYEGGKAKRLNVFINPEGKIEYTGHGLTKKELKKKGARALGDVAGEIDEFLKGATLAGHNIKNFDIPVLQANLAKAGINVDLTGRGIVDTLEIEKALSPGQSAKLGEVFARVAGRPLKNAHNAAVDVAATAHILRKQLATLGSNFDKNLASLGEEGLSKGINTLLNTLGPRMEAQSVIESLKRLGNMVIGYGATGKKVRLDQLLSTPEKIRGMSDTALSAMYKGQQAVVMEDVAGRKIKEGQEFVSDILQKRKRFTDAKRVISQITKSRGVSIPEGIPFLRKGMTASQALQAAYNIVDKYTARDLPAMYTKLGIMGLAPLAKADFLVEAQKQLVVPASSARELFGVMHDARAQSKGLHQYYRSSGVSKLQADRLVALGERPVPYFATQQELAKTPKKLVATRQTFRAIVVDFNSEIAAQLLTQDSGAILTEKGLAKTARRQHLSQVKYKGAGRDLLYSLEVLTGKSALDGELADLFVSKAEFSSATNFSIKSKHLTARERAVRNLIYASNKKKGRVERQGFGIFKQIASGELPGMTGGLLVAPKYEQGVLTLNILSKEAMAAGSVGLVMGGVRETGVAVRTDHVLSRDLEMLGSLDKSISQTFGVDILKARGDFQKMATIDVFLENFHAILQRNGLDAQFSKILGPGVQKFINTSTGFTIATAASKGEAAKRAMRVIKELRKMGVNDPKYKEIADQMLRKSTFGSIPIAGKPRQRGPINLNRIGAAVSLATLPGLEKIATGATIVEIPGFIRSDQRLDTNTANRAKITLGKYKTLAFGAPLLGYKNPMEDPLVRDLTFNFKMFGWDPKKNDFVLGNDHPIKRFLKALTEPDALKLKESEIITIKKGELYLGDRKLKALPDIAQFKDARGGVSRDALKGTILDPDIGDFFYLDTGKKQKLNLLGQDVKGKDILGGAEHRYIPIPKQLLRIEKAVDGRIVLGKTHPAYPVLKLLSAIEGGAKLSSLRGDITDAMKSIFENLGGKEGYLSKMHTIHLPAGYSARLVPQQATVLTAADFADPMKMFEAAVSRKQIISALEARRGSMEKSLFDKLYKSAKEDQFMYSMLMADPTQRPGHMSAFKIQLLDTPLAAEAAGRVHIAELGIDMQMHPLAYGLFERDTDNDKMVMNLLANEPSEIEERIARQAKAMAPTLGFFEEQFSKAPGMASSVGRVGKETVKEMFSAFIGQKAFASLGYSQVRPTAERLLPTLLAEGEKGLREAGVRIGGGAKAISVSEINEIRTMYMGKLTAPDALEIGQRRLAGSLALGQYLFQSGVKKGSTKLAQRELNLALINIADTAKQSYNLEDILTKSYKAFERFVESSDKLRIFEAGQVLMETSTPKVLEGLIEGAAKGSKEYIQKKAAALMAMSVGLGYGLSSKVSSIGTVAGFAEDNNIFQEVKQLYKRIFKPLAGVSEKSSGLSPEIEEIISGGKPKVTRAEVPPPKSFGERLSKIKSGLLDDLTKMAKSKYFKPVAVGVAALSGIGLINRATAPDTLSSPLPPPTDTTQPMDMGPTLPDLKPPPRLNTSSFTPSAGRYRHNQKFGPINSNLFGNRVDNRVIVNDNTSSRQNSWLLRRQMDKESESDFAY